MSLATPTGADKAMATALRGSSTLDATAVQIWLEALPEGQFTAWVVGLPGCKVVADSQDEAMTALREALLKRMSNIKIVSLPITGTENPWLPFCGILKDDPLFNEWADRFWEEKQAIDDDEELSVEELLGTL